jgi:hypothetical protein
MDGGFLCTGPRGQAFDQVEQNLVLEQMKPRKEWYLEDRMLIEEGLQKMCIGLPNVSKEKRISR